MASKCHLAVRIQLTEETSMAVAVIADCIERSKATADQELISAYISEALGVCSWTTPNAGQRHR